MKRLATNPGDLVLEHEGLVRALSRPYAGLGLERDDFEQEGRLGLMTAADRFEPERGVPFSAFARHWVRYRMQRFLRSNRALVPLPQTRAIRRARRGLRSASTTLEARLGRRATRAELAEELGVEERDVEHVIGELGVRDLPMSTETGLERASTAAEQSPEHLAARKELRRDAERHVEAALEPLDERERRIVTERRLRESPRTLRELGDELRISAERVRQLEKRALKKMRERLHRVGAAETCARQLAV